MADKRAVNKTAEAIVICLCPDVCKTPMGPAVVPVPYPIISKFDLAQNTSPDVNFEGAPVFHLESYLSTVTGDEAGVAGGVASAVNKGCCRPVEHSSTLRTNGKWVVRHGDLMEMNTAGPKGTSNTKGKILFISVVKMARVNPDGSIEFQGERETTTEDGSTTVEDVHVKQSADGTTTTVETSSVTRDAEGNVIDSRLELQTHHLEGAGSPPGDFPRITTAADREAEIRTLGEPLHETELPDDHPDVLNDPEYQEAQREAQAAQAEIAALEREKQLDALQAVVDVAGIADPTPISDAVSAGMSLGRGDYLGAGLSVVSMVPYFGDALAKPLKGAKAAVKGTKLGMKLEKAAVKLKKAKEAAEFALKKAKGKLGKLGKEAKDAKKVEEAAVASAENGGRIIKSRKLSTEEKKKYARGKFRKGKREEVWNQTRKDSPDGIVRDPVTQKEIKFEDDWEMGHKEGHEFWKHQQSASERGVSREQFLDEINETGQYRPELPESNHGHLGELKTDEYFGR